MPNATAAFAPLLAGHLVHHAYVLERTDDTGVRWRQDRWMALRSALHRLFGIGKTSRDLARNRASWTALLHVIEARAGREVRDRVQASPLALRGDRAAGLTVGQRIERGSYLSASALTAVGALFDEACRVKLVNDQAYASLFRPCGDHVVHPLQAVLDDILAGADTMPGAACGHGAPFPLRETRIYAARQLKAAVQQRCAADGLRHDLPALAKALARQPSDLDALRTDEQRAQWLKQHDAALLSSASRGVAADTDRSIAALLSEWHRNALLDAVRDNADAISREFCRLTRLAAEDGAFDAEPVEGMHPVVPQPGGPASESDALRPEIPPSSCMVTLLAQRCMLLAELKGRELADAIRRCDEHLSVAADPIQSARWESRRRQLVSQWQRDDLAQEKERDLLRQEQVRLLQDAVFAEVQRCTAAGQKLDDPAMASIVMRLLSRPAFLRPFIVARNLQYLYDVGHGPRRCSELARLLRACDTSTLAPVGGIHLDDSDLAWLAAGLDAGEAETSIRLHRVPSTTGPAGWGSAKLREWPVQVLCDMAAARLDEYAEERRLALHRWRGCTVSLEVRWRAGVAALRDTLRHRELGPEDLAPFAVEALKGVLHARHLEVRKGERLRRAAESQIDQIRSLCPALAGWKTETPVGAAPPSLFDLASACITDRLINAHNVRLEGGRAMLAELEHRQHDGMVAPVTDVRMMPWQAGAVPCAEPGVNPLRDMMRTKQQIEQGIRQAMDGTGTSEGLLMPACRAIEDFARLWADGNAALLEIGHSGAHGGLISDLASLRSEALRALRRIETIRRIHVPEGLDCTGMPPEIAERAEAELRLARQELENLERAVQAIVESIRDEDRNALVVSTSSALPLPAMVVPTIRRGLRYLARQLL